MRIKLKITRRQFGQTTAGLGLLTTNGAGETVQAGGQTADYLLAGPGIWRVRLGKPEPLTPVQVRHYQPVLEQLNKLPAVKSAPVDLATISGTSSLRGYEVGLPLEPGEMVYGLGLQFRSFLQRGLKKKLRINADPAADLGDSHAPVPFYVTTRGYGVLVDTARYATFYCGNNIKKDELHLKTVDEEIRSRVAQLPPAYERFHMDQASRVLIEIPEAQGVDIYVFAGPAMSQAVQRYNLFAGGGPLPPRWGLGFWYRGYGEFTQQDVVKLAKEMRESSLPCDVFGLEPGWQSHSYSCSFTWSDKFPKPHEMLAELSEANYQVNLWEHAFTHPSSPIHQGLMPYSGDYEVWDGLVPDFLGQTAREVFGNYHERELVAHGVSGFKLDECDNSDYTRCWSFPELSRFPSGADGEQMHCFFGLKYQQTIQAIFDRGNTRTFGLVRSSHALATPYAFVLYSDLYDHKEFIRGVVNAGFSGLLWCPEVRDAENTEDLIRRLQTVIFSPLAMVNAWYIKNPPWKQVDRAKNNAGEFAEGWQVMEAACRRLIELRMQLVPYLYAAYVRYHKEGMPPFRALVMDYPDDPKTWTVDDQYLAGDSLLIAPVTAGENHREVYLPEGEWIDFWTNQRYGGRRKMNLPVPIDRMPVFVKAGSIIPLAKPTLHTQDAEAFKLTVRVYGDGKRSTTLYEDDGTPNPAFTTVTLAWDSESHVGTIERSGPDQPFSYEVERWENVAAD